MNEFSPSYYTPLSQPVLLLICNSVEASLKGSEIKRIVDMQQNKWEVIRTCTISRVVGKCLLSKESFVSFLTPLGTVVQSREGMTETFCGYFESKLHFIQQTLIEYS